MEERVNQLDSRIRTLETQVSEAQLANKAMLDEATAQAVESAQRAENSATAAESAAQRAEKIFELNQRK